VETAGKKDKKGFVGQPQMMNKHRRGRRGDMKESLHQKARKGGVLGESNRFPIRKKRGGTTSCAKARMRAKVHGRSRLRKLQGIARKGEKKNPNA